MSSIEFYFYELSAPSRAVWMVLEELGLKYNEKVLDLLKGEQKTEEYLKINARGQVPSIKDGDFCLAESRAVAAYLVSKYGKKCNKQSLYPQDPKGKAIVDMHMYVDVNLWDQIKPYVNPRGVIFRGEPTKTEDIDKVKSALQTMEDFLTKHTYIAADNLTIVDFFSYTIVGMLTVTEFDEFSSYPKLCAWRKKISELPYHKKTFEEPMAKFRAFYQDKLKQNAQKLEQNAQKD